MDDETIPGLSPEINIPPRRNLAYNPSFEVNNSTDKSAAWTVAQITYAPAVVHGSKALSAEIKVDTATIYSYIGQKVKLDPGTKFIGGRADVRWSAGSRYVRPTFIFYNSANAQIGGGISGDTVRAINSHVTHRLAVKIPEGAAWALFAIYVYDDQLRTIPPKNGTSIATDAWVISPGATLEEVEASTSTYWDGNSAPASVPYTPARWVSSWDGTPGASASRRVAKAPGEWAREWWESLPLAYRVADRDEVGGYPLLRYMEGPGSVAQKVRALGQDFWDGVFTDPLRVPDGKPLRWLAMVLGLKVTGGDADLRARLVELVENGRSPDGTKGAIADATRPYLLGSRQVQVTPDPANPNQIIVFVRADEVPAQGLAWVAAQIQRLGIAPAGHQIILKAATSTWDKWTADVGATWDQVEVNIPTWAKSDAAGVVLE